MAHLQAEGKAVIKAVATAGTTDAGAIDPLEKIREITNKYGSWMHDAAVGRCTDSSNDYRAMLMVLNCLIRSPRLP